MRHDVDLRRHGVRAPDDHAVGLGHLARIGTGQNSGSSDIASPGRRDADGRVLAGVALDVPEPVDAVAHHQAHCAGIVIGPDRFRSERALRLEQLGGGDVQRLFPGNALETARTLRTAALQGMKQPLGMVYPLGVAGDLRADHALGVGLVLGPAHTTDAIGVKHFHFQRAGGGAVVRAGRKASGLGMKFHGRNMPPSRAAGKPQGPDPCSPPAPNPADKYHGKNAAFSDPAAGTRAGNATP